MQVLREEYGPFEVKLVMGNGGHLHGEADAFAGHHNCNMDREFQAVNNEGKREVVSRYDAHNAGRRFMVGSMEFSNNQYRIKRGTVLREIDPNAPAQSKEPEEKPVQTPAEEPVQEPVQEPAQTPVEEPEEEMPTFDMSMFESKLTEGLNYNKYCKNKLRG